jgi:urease accessory protein
VTSTRGKVEPLLQARTWLPRAQATVRLSFKSQSGVRDGATVLDTLHQAGAGRARFPNPSEGGAGAQAQAILLNMAGGLTGGDRFDVDLGLSVGAKATVTTAAAEKIYRSLHGDPAHIQLDARLADGAALLWLPQPTILFDRAVLERRTSIDLAPGATLLAAECLIFGRAAMGEDVVSGGVADPWRIRRGDRLIYADTLRLSGSVAEALDRPAVLSGARATATVIYVAADAGQRLEAVRELIAAKGGGASIGASAWGEILLLRGLAKDGRTLQVALRPVIEALSGRLLPRIWQC